MHIDDILHKKSLVRDWRKEMGTIITREIVMIK